MTRHEHTLFIECRGCDFFPGDRINQLSNVGNYRVGVYDYSIKAKNGKTYILEFNGCDRWHYRTTNKRNGQPLKNPVKELIKERALHLDSQYDEEREGGILSFRDCPLEHDIFIRNLDYTLENILQVVNEISIKQYNNIVTLCDEKIKYILDDIYKMGGFRERDIIENLATVKRKQYDKNYYVVSFISKNGDSFDYEMFSKRITG